MNILFLAWQDPVSRAWFPIGRLAFDGKIYQFVYTQGVQAAQQQCGFRPLLSFPHLDKAYESPELFPLFSNRLLSRSRPDYADFVQWLNVPPHEDGPIAILARSGGQRATDTLAVFPYPERDEHGLYHIHFFAHGLRHLPPETIQISNRLQSGEPLRLVHDLQNPYDRRALMLCTEERYIVGYYPQYLLDDVFEMLLQYPDQVHVAVERVNPPPTPIQFRLLCNLTARWPLDFHLFSSQMYQPLRAELAVASL